MAPERCASAKDLLKKFYQLQEERIQTYALFEEGYQSYLRGKPNYNFPLYRQLVHEITETFQGISADVISIRTELNAVHQRMLLSDCIDKVQEQEKEKLELVAQLQILRQKMQDEPAVESHAEEVKEKKTRLKQIDSAICSHMEDLKYEAEDLYQ
ncbi:required for excision 1-B domain-containing protein-like [Argonauta hians]